MATHSEPREVGGYRLPVLDRVVDEWKAGAWPAPRKRRVELLLGTDREIGRERRSVERRVGITPGQAAALVQALSGLGIELNVMVVRGAGERAGCSDAAYIDAGCEIIEKELLADLDGPPDVVHALKEPSPYEREIPGPFCRIGALHSGGGFSEQSGLAGLLCKAEKVAVFDGSHIGDPDGWRIPIRGKMSLLAGEVGARWILDHLLRTGMTGRVLLVGCGNAGRAAIETFRLGSSPIQGVDAFDAAPPDRLAAIADKIAALGAGEGTVQLRGLGVEDPKLLEAARGAVAALFAPAAPKSKAPRLFQADALLRALAPGAILVDISIDEGGVIADPGLEDRAAGRTLREDEIIGFLEDRFREGGLTYRAATNMPRAYPRRASELHGEVILPYLAALLLLSASEGTTAGVLRRLRQMAPRSGHPDPADAPPGQTLPSLLQDLRNGLAFGFSEADPPGPAHRVDIEPVVASAADVARYLSRMGVACSTAG